MSWRTPLIRIHCHNPKLMPRFEQCLITTDGIDALVTGYKG